MSAERFRDKATSSGIPKAAGASARPPDTSAGATVLTGAIDTLLNSAADYAGALTVNWSACLRLQALQKG
jgi:hypothetical protein